MSKIFLNMFTSVEKNTLTLKLDKMFYLFRLVLHYKNYFQQYFIRLTQ
jgi:hypothetical protein